MILLSITTSSIKGSLSLIDQNKHQVLDEVSWEEKNSHGKNVHPYLETLLKKNKVNFENIKALACDVGPGSFTGIRVAVNLARVISYTKNIPVFCENSLKIMSLNSQDSKQKIFCVVNAFGGKVFYAYFENSKTIKKASLISLDDLKKQLNKKDQILGDLSLILDEKWLEKNKITFRKDAYPLSSKLGLWAVKQDKSKWKSWTEVLPMYMKGL